MAITAPASRSSVLGAKDEPGGASDGVSHLTPGRIERRGAGRVRVGEAMSAAELETGRLPGAGVGDVLEERRERLGQLRTGRSGLGPLNRTIDAFVAVAADTQLSFDFLTHPDGAHAFDVLNDVPRSKGIIESTLQFIKSNLVVTQA